ncbi:uncharacterized protein CEXT_108441 [Caerostris extrusa]|uniref:Uncharacterized protein n=1 Tax=Caerostris extrusa TaxID=172846 RepID=A0AAV4SRR7_CAEEX|nr:uncharacterized protein CEXT_108441 [Caerostris extrusa]
MVTMRIFDIGLLVQGDDLDSLQLEKSKRFRPRVGGRESAFESWPGVAFIDLVRSIFPNHMVRVRVPKARRKDWRSRDLPKGHIPGGRVPDASLYSVASVPHHLHFILSRLMSVSFHFCLECLCKKAELSLHQFYLLMILCMSTWNSISIWNTFIRKPT